MLSLNLFSRNLSHFVVDILIILAFDWNISLSVEGKCFSSYQNTEILYIFIKRSAQRFYVEFMRYFHYNIYIYNIQI